MTRARLVDVATGRELPDVLRLEPAPIEFNESRWFGTIYVHRRDAAGVFLYEADATPISDREFVELVVGTVWEA